MPYRPEGSLLDWLRKRETKELLSPPEVAHIISQAADALQHAHDHQVIHQDVKPSNFLVRTRKDSPTLPDLLLSDFGIARVSSSSSSVSQSVRGTPSYMAPEQWEGDATETLPPAPSSNTWSQQCGPAHVLEIGTIGNNIFNSNQFGTASYSVFTNSSMVFTNGKDSQNYVEVQQSDIDTAANALVQADSPNAQQLLQPQLSSNERFIDTPQCNPNVSSNHRAGDSASSVTVFVSFACTSIVYNSDGARLLATQLLTQQATTHPGSGYVLVGSITTNVTSAKLTDQQHSTVTLIVDAQGKWVYQFTDTQKQSMAKLVAGKKKGEAQPMLSAQPGIAQVNIQLSGGDGVTLPTDASLITIEVKNTRG